MWPDFLRPPAAASVTADRVDRLFAFTVVVALVFSALIFGLVVYFGIKYRRRPETPFGESPRSGAALLETVWSAVPLGILLVMFYWGLVVYFDLSRPPPDAEQLFVVGRQWMWKIQHPGGQREIDELHVPAGRPIKLLMTSEDVIHSFYVPAFRIKMDVVPGRYSVEWFQATTPGTYHLFCAEYCGTQHSGMIGRVIVMEPSDYDAWLAGARPTEGPVASGAALFTTLGCSACHRPDTAVRAPILTGLLGGAVRLESGATIRADEDYLRESILKPRAKVVAGYPPVMPAFEGRLSEEEVLALVSYIGSLKGEGAGGGER